MNRVKQCLAFLIIVSLMFSMIPGVMIANGETEGSFKGWNVTLSDNIGANFYFSIDKGDVANTAVNITIAEETVTIKASNAAQVDGCYVFNVDMAAAQMTDSIYVELVTNGEIVHSNTYSIRQYAQSVLAGEYNKLTKDLVLQMLNYGAAAQNYFSYNTSKLANVGYENEISAASVPETIDSIVTEGSVDGIRLYGMSLVFESQIAVRFYYSVSEDVENYSFTTGDQKNCEIQMGNGMYYVEVSDINPQNYTDIIMMQVSDGTESMSVGYSPLHYIVRKYHTDTSEGLKALVQAMYGYHLASVAYQREAMVETIELPLCFDMNVASNDFVLTDSQLTGKLLKVSVKGTNIFLENAVLTDNTLTIPAESFCLSDMPSGQLTVRVETDEKIVDISGEFIWVIQTVKELYEMKNHLTSTDGVSYDGSLALGKDLNGTVTISKYHADKHAFGAGEVFAGTFDGRMHSIENVVVASGGCGIFYNVSGRVCNLKILDSEVKSYAGVIVGNILTGKLDNIYIRGSITADGMKENSNFNNFGCGLVAGRYKKGATAQNIIAEVIQIADRLHIATAMGKLGDSYVTENAFTNCYVVNSAGNVFMGYEKSPVIHDFTAETTNGSYETMLRLWGNPQAAELFFQLIPSLDCVDDQMESYCVDGTIHSYNATDTGKYISKNKASDYAVVISSQAGKRVVTAAKDFRTFYAEATGIQLRMIYAENISSFTEQSKYIVIGENSLLHMAGLETDLNLLGIQGFQIQTVGNSVFILGTDAGAQYGTYQLLTELFQFDYYGKNSYTLSRNVNEVPLKNYDITDVPDISIRRPNYLFLMSDSVTSDRMRLMNWGDLIIPVGGSYVHNSSKYINKNDYPDKAKWFATDGKNLCYTAHGDAKEMEQMQRIVADVIITHLEANPTKTLITMTQEDTQTLCECTACTKLMNTYNGSRAASVVIFLNGVCELVEQHFTDEKTGQCERVFSILFFAYHATNKPPVIYDEKQKAFIPIDEKVICNEHLIPYFAETNGDYTTNFYDTESVNLAYGENLEGWSVLSKKIYFWMYSTNFKYYLTPYNTFDSTQANYKFAIENHVDFIYDQAQSNQTGSATGWSLLKIYLYSKLTWNVDQDMDSLIHQFMEGFYGPAAETVEEVFRQWKTYANYQTEVLGYSGSRSIFYEALDSKLWNQQLLHQWVNMLTEAIEEVAVLKETDSAMYEQYVKNIATERIAYNYLLLTLFQHSMTEEEIALAKEQFYHDQQLANIGLQGERTGSVSNWMKEMEIGAAVE